MVYCVLSAMQDDELVFFFFASGSSFAIRPPCISISTSECHTIPIGQLTEDPRFYAASPCLSILSEVRRRISALYGPSSIVEQRHAKNNASTFYFEALVDVQDF